MKEQEILNTMAAATGVEAEVIRKAFSGCGEYFDLHRIGMMILEEEGFTKREIGRFFELELPMVNYRIGSGKELMDMRGPQSAGFKRLYLVCTQAVEGIDEEVVRVKLPSTEAEKIIAAVVKVCRVSKAEIASASRVEEFIHARYIAITIMRNNCGTLSLKEIGRHVGDRDHSSVIYALEQFEFKMENNRNFRNKYHQVIKELQA